MSRDGRIDCVVIGAGPGGLGSAAMLTRRGLSVQVLERGTGVGEKWRNGYDRLRINSSAWFSYLPGMRIPRSVGRWPTRDELVAYYAAYARRFGLDIRFETEALRVDRQDDAWVIRTNRGDVSTRAVVVATAKDHTPTIPPWPGSDTFRGELIHSAQYRNADSYRGKKVLVVGAGNSGQDIALDLHDGGAADVALAIRKPPHIIHRELLGLPNDLLAVLSRRLPKALVDIGAEFIRRLKLGDLEQHGLGRPPVGMATNVARSGMIPTIDGGDFVKSIREGRIGIVAAVQSFDEDTVRLEDDSRLHPDLVVAATGYLRNLEPLVGHLGLLDSNGRPVCHGQRDHPAAPRIHFIGFTDPISGNLRELRLVAKHIASAIARSLQ